MCHKGDEVVNSGPRAAPPCDGHGQEMSSGEKNAPWDTAGYVVLSVRIRPYGLKKWSGMSTGLAVRSRQIQVASIYGKIYLYLARYSDVR